MAATTTPIVWDFFRVVDGAEGLGSVVEYRTAEAQSLYLADGLQTRTERVEEGDWEGSELADQITLLPGVPSASAWDNPALGHLYGVGIHGNELRLYRYLSELEIADFVRSGTAKARNDSQIVQTSLTIDNPGEDVMLAPATFFEPGAKLTVRVAMGNSAWFSLGVAYVDELDYDAHAETLPLSGRNTIGYRLGQQTFDDNTSFEGTGKQVVEWIFSLAGVEDYVVGPSDTVQQWTFEPSDTFAKGLEKVFEFFAPWTMAELPSGKIVVGYPWWISTYIANSVYQFSGNRDVFRRKTKKSADAAYSHVRVTGKAADGTELTPVLLPVETFSHWRLGEHKTKHVKAADGMTQTELQTYAENLAASLANIGVGEQFTGPMRPYLLVGDIASVSYDDQTSTDLGLVTSITHKFGMTGFSTDFAIDSGGVAARTRSASVTTQSAAVSGYNRHQNLADLIGVVVGQSGGGKAGQAAAIDAVSTEVRYLPVGAAPSVSVQTGGTAQDRTFAFIFELPLAPGDVILQDTATGRKYLAQLAGGRMLLTPVDAMSILTPVVLADATAGLNYTLALSARRVTLTETEDDPTGLELADVEVGKRYTAAVDDGRLIFVEV